MSELSTKRLFVVNNSEATETLIIALQRHGQTHGLEYACQGLYEHIAGENPTPRHFDRVLTNTAIREFLASDAVVTFGTWGSTHPNRQADQIDCQRQASVDNLNRIFVSLAREYNKPVIVMETATLSRVRYNYLGDEFKSTAKGLYPRYIRISRDHWTWNKGRWLSPLNRTENRIKYFRKVFKSEYDIELPIFEHQWKNVPDGCVLICAGLEHDPTSSMPVLTWIEETVRAVVANTNRPIRIRLHPLSLLNVTHLLNHQISLDRNNIRLKNAVKDVYCAILDASTSVFELVELGIPVITGDNSFGKELGNTDISKINALHYADAGAVAAWYNQMAWTEFHQTEIEIGKVLPYIRELIE